MVSYLSVNERKYPVRISYKVLKQLSALSEDDKKGEYEQTELLLFLSLQNGAKHEGVNFELDREGLEDLIDEHPEVLSQFVEIMNEQMQLLTGKMGGVMDMEQTLSTN